MNTLHWPSQPPIQPAKPDGRVLQLAMEIAGNLSDVCRWYAFEELAEFGYQTASEVESSGHVRLLVEYLEQIVRGERG